MLQLQQGPVLDHTKPGPQVTWLGLYDTEAEIRGAGQAVLE